MWEVEAEYAKKNLLLLGFSSSQEYLKSRLFKSIFLRVLKSSGGKCRFCDTKAVKPFFATCREEVLRGERLWSIIPVCITHRQQIQSKRDFGILMGQLRGKELSQRLRESGS